jgi:hypothetical protein
MCGVACSLAICRALNGCAQIYAPTSKNPALVHVPATAAFGVGDQIHLVAIDGVSVGTAVNGEDWRIDPGTRQLAINYEASKKIVGPRVASSPLVLKAKLEPGMKYEVIVEGSKTGVKAFVRRQSDNRIVSNSAESSLISAPPTYPSPPPLFQIPALRHH